MGMLECSGLFYFALGFIMINVIKNCFINAMSVLKVVRGVLMLENVIMVNLMLLKFFPKPLSSEAGQEKWPPKDEVK